jgi:hypothetical protein
MAANGTPLFSYQQRADRTIMQSVGGNNANLLRHYQFLTSQNDGR